MLAEFNEVVHGVAESYRSEPAKVEAVEQDIVSEDDTDLKNTVELLRGVVWYNL